MQPNNELVKVESSSRYRRYLLLIGILAIAFSLSFVIRAMPMTYGLELDEFDPFFNYRATEFIVENGIPAYLEWNDDLSWHPYGRDVSATSQVMLHVTAATLYQAFGQWSSLYNFTIMFPVIISSLTAIVVFAVVRTIGGNTAGILASLFFAVSPILVMRGSIGWFKSEPLGLFFGFLAVYLVISAIKSGKWQVAVAKLVGGGILLACGLASWGGTQFLILPIGFFFLALPFLRNDNKFIVWTPVIFTSVFFLTILPFERTGIDFITGINGIFLAACTGFLVVCVIIKKISKNQLRYCFGLLGGVVIAGLAIILSGVISMGSFRHLNAANPLLTTTDLLVDSVAEHATSTIDITFHFFSILMVFAGIGVWLIFQKKVIRYFNIKSEMVAFSLIIGIIGIYFGSAFVRLEVFSSISIIVLSSIGLSILISKILSLNVPQQEPTGKIRKIKYRSFSTVTKISFLSVIVVLLTIPMAYPTGINWSNYHTLSPLPILNSGTHYDISTNDWPESMGWLKENTHKDSVIAAWWDYGYWISTLSERKSLADNSTVLDWQIRKIASTYMSTPENAWRILTADADTNVGEYFVSLPHNILEETTNQDKTDKFSTSEQKIWQFKNFKDKCTGSPENEASTDVDCYWKPGVRLYEPEIAKNYPTLFDYWQTEIYNIPRVLTGLDADYIMINLTVKKLPKENVLDLYTIPQKGGDESKAFWFIKISDLHLRDYYQQGFSSYTDKFWDDTLLGHLIPFTLITYVDPNNTEIQSKTFKPGFLAVYVKDVKFPSDEDGPFQLVHMSPSFENDNEGILVGPIIYKINKEYQPELIT